LLTPSESLPAPGQGALGIECLESRADLAGLLAPLNHADTAQCIAAERAFSLALSGNCNLPLGAYAEMNGAHLRLRGFVGTADGSRIVSGELEGPAGDPRALGAGLAERLKAQGAADILAKLQQ
jgi:hydroxymethylbilane synthase